MSYIPDYGRRPIFCDLDPVLAARHLDDRTLADQVVICAQALDTASYPQLASLSHDDFALWAAGSKPAYDWLLAHCLALLSTWSDRQFGRVHHVSPAVHRALAVSAYRSREMVGLQPVKRPGFPKTVPTANSSRVQKDRLMLRTLWLERYVREHEKPEWSFEPVPDWVVAGRADWGARA